MNEKLEGYLDCMLSANHLGRDRMVVGFTTTCAFTTKIVNSSSARGEVYSIHYVIKFVSDLRQVGGFFWILQFPPPNKIDHHDITEILLKVVLNSITPSFDD